MRTFIYSTCLLLLISCEPKDEKTSRLTIDTYTNKLNLIMGAIVETRVEEGQPQLTADNLYGNIVPKLDQVINELNSFKITSDYMPYRDIQVASANNLNNYIVYRKDAIASMNRMVSLFDSVSLVISDYEEYVRLKNSLFSDREYYADLAKKSLDEYYQKAEGFLSSKNSYYRNLQGMDSVLTQLDSTFTVYNQKIMGSKLKEEILWPVSFRDSVNDWLVSSKSYYLDLQIHPPDL